MLIVLTAEREMTLSEVKLVSVDNIVDVWDLLRNLLVGVNQVFQILKPGKGSSSKSRCLTFIINAGLSLIGLKKYIISEKKCVNP